MTPELLVAITISSYWACVLLMSIRSRVKFKTASGSIPKAKVERLMWLLWVPTIVAWIALTWNGSNQVTKWLANTANVGWGSAWQTALWMAAIATLFAFVITTRCWMSMGKNWSMAVRPDKKTDLITDGMFAFVRHPIYALSLLLMIGSLIVNLGWPMLLVATIHCSMLVMKSLNEERYLAKLHGQQYNDYLQRTSRFFPLRAVRNIRFAKSA